MLNVYHVHNHITRQTKKQMYIVLNVHDLKALGAMEGMPFASFDFKQ